MRHPEKVVLFALICLALVKGCRPAPQGEAPKKEAAVAAVRFTDVSAQSGLRFRHQNGAFGLRMMPETIGSGVCVFDYDDDGWPDIYFVNSREWTRGEINDYFAHEGKAQRGKIKIPATQAKATGALYRNLGDGTFSDVTQGSGLAIETFGQGACAADYDSDGKVDLYITSWPHNFLFRNKGGGQFEDVTQRSGVSGGNWSSAALWLDYDKDGRLDLFVGRYLKWSPKLEKYNTAMGRNGAERAYGGPDFYEGLTPLLFRNKGNGTFEDVSSKTGVATALVSGKRLPLQGKTLGAVAIDYDRDGWMDIAVCNDRLRNFLFHNRRGQFEEVGQSTNFAFANNGSERAGMGTDAADTDHSTYESLAVGNFDQEMLGLFQNMNGKVFLDVAELSDAGRSSRNRLTFGCVFADLNSDTWPDVATANGHIQPGVDGVRRDTAHAQEPLILINLGPRQAPSPINKAENMSYAAFSEPTAWITPVPRLVGRGLAAADFDRDGDVDLVFSANGGPAYLLRNDTVTPNHTLRVILQGSGTNRQAIGAVVWVDSEKVSLRRTVRAGHSYASQSELPLTFGLGALEKVPTLTVRWPSGKTSTLNNIKADQEIVINEATGIIKQTPLRTKSGA